MILGNNINLILSIVVFVLFVISLFISKLRKEKVVPVVLLTAFIAFTSYSISFFINVLPVENLNDKDAIITGTLCDLPSKSYDKYYYVIETDSISIDDCKQKTKIKVSIPTALDVDVYDKIECKVHLYTSSNKENGLDSQAYYNSKGIYARGYIYEYDNIEIEKLSNSEKPIYFYVLEVRRKIISSIRIMLPDECSAIICGVLLGDKQGLNENIINNFKTIGVSHILAVSGLHVSIIGQFLFILLILIKIPKKFAAILSSMGIIFMMLITGLSPSVVRAGIMYILYFISMVFDRKSDSLNSLGLAVLIITLINPLAAGDIGLLLSFTSTLGLIVLNPKIFNWLNQKTSDITFIPKKFIRGLNATLSTTFSATLFTLPLSLMIFGEISIISPIANLLIVLPTTIMMISSLFAIVFYFAGVLSFLSNPFIIVTGIISKYIINCSNLLASIPFASISAMQEYVLIWVSATLILIALLILFKLENRYIKLISLSSAVILLSGIISYQFANYNVIKLAVLDSGNGSSIVLSKMGRAAVITCGGNSLSEQNIDNFLKYSNVKSVDYLLISEIDKKVSSASSKIINKYDPLIIAINSEIELDDKLSRELESNLNTCRFSDKAVCNLWGNVCLNVYTDSEKPFIKLEVNDLNILISPLGGKIENTDLLSYDYDFFIPTKLPTNFKEIGTDYTIFSMEEKKAKRDMSIIGEITNKAIMLPEQGSVIIESYDDSTVCIKRALF